MGRLNELLSSKTTEEYPDDVKAFLGQEVTEATEDESLGNSLKDLSEEAPDMDVPSIHSAAVLVDLHISQWQARRKDRGASEKITSESGAVRHSADVRKSLLPGCAEHDAIKKFVANNRNVHYDMTMPWSDRGARLLPTARLFDFHKHVTGIKDEFDRLCEAFFTVYEWEAIQAEARLGDMFQKDDYPSLEEVRRKYRFDIAYMPVPDGGDFRLDVGNEAVELLQEHYQEFYTDRVQNAMDDMWKRLYTPLQNMSSKLDYSTKEHNTKFRDTLVSNVVDIVGMLKDFNITGDVHLEACRAKLEAALHGITPEALREDDTLRAETKRSVDEVLRDLPSLDI